MLTYEQEHIDRIIKDYNDNPNLQEYKAKIKIFGLTKNTNTLNLSYKQLIQIFKMFSQYEKDK